MFAFLASGKSGDKKAQKKRGKKLDVNSFDNATELFAGNLRPSLNTESSDDLFSAPSAILPVHAERELEESENLLDEAKSDYKMDNLQVIISPLTDEKIRKINTPNKKRKGLAKACQTEICGLAWRIEFDQINFRSEHFDKLRALLNSGAARNVLRRANDEGKIVSPKKSQKDNLGNLDGVAMCRDVLQSALDSPASAPSTISLSDPAAESTSNARSSVESLLFQKRINEVEAPPTNPNDENAQKQLVVLFDYVCCASKHSIKSVSGKKFTDNFPYSEDHKAAFDIATACDFVNLRGHGSILR